MENLHDTRWEEKSKAPERYPFTDEPKNCVSVNITFDFCYTTDMHIYIFLFLLGAVLGLFACEFADRWGCSQKYRSSQPKKLFILCTSGIAAVALYWWEVEMGMLMPAATSGLRAYTPFDAFFGPTAQRYIVHLILFTFLLTATLTDFYEMIIPDSITVVGTVMALLFAVLFQFVALPATVLLNKDDTASTVRFLEENFSELMERHPEFKEHSAELLETARWYKDNNIATAPLNVWSPNMLPVDSLYYVHIAEFGDKQNIMIIPKFLPVMILLWWFWCFAMLDRVWYTKLPFRKANAIFWRYLYRSPRTKYIIAAALLASLGFVCMVFAPVELLFTSDMELALYSALVGMAFGMVLVWGIRLVARWVLGIEAMGFGDVTLMGMIGAFLGWQAVLLVFFAAPFFGLVYGIVNLALGRGRAVPYGPFLCLATVVVVIFWSPIWSATAEYFAFGIGTISIALLVLLVLFGGLLHVVHKVMGRRRN